MKLSSAYPYHVTLLLSLAYVSCGVAENLEFVVPDVDCEITQKAVAHEEENIEINRSAEIKTTTDKGPQAQQPSLAEPFQTITRFRPY